GGGGGAGRGRPRSLRSLPLALLTRAATGEPVRYFFPLPFTSTGSPASACSLAHRAVARSHLGRAEAGGEGRTRTFEAARATDLQSAAFDRFATSPMLCCLETCVSVVPKALESSRSMELAKG